MKKLIWVIIGTIVLGALLIFTISQEEKDRDDSISFYVNGTLRIDSWEDSEHKLVYAFLPSCADLNTTTVSIPKGMHIVLDKKELVSGVACSDFSWNTEYPLIINGSQVKTMVFKHAENTPAVFVETVKKGAIARVHGDEDHKEHVAVSLYKASGELAYQGSSTDLIRAHGNSTLRKEKKSYNLYLQTASALVEGREFDRWVLLANATDATNLRNKTVFDFAKSIGNNSLFSPESEFVDLYINGEYRGLYLLCEPVLSAAKRMVPSVSDSQTILYQFELPWRLEGDGFLDQYGRGIQIKSPNPYSDEDEAAVLECIAGIYQSASSAYSFGQTESNTRETIDVDSWCRKYLIEEVFCNTDAGTASQYFILDRGDKKVYAGPCWDYDLSIGKTQSVLWWTPNTLWAAQSSIYGKVIEKDSLQDRILQLYRDEYSPKLHLLAEKELTSSAQSIEAAAEMNSIRWSKLYDDPWDTLENLTSFLLKRIEFLDKIWIEKAACNSIRFSGVYASPVYVIKGEPAEVPNPQAFGFPEGAIWTREDTGEEFDLYQESINEDLVLRVSVPENQHQESVAAEEEVPRERLTLRWIITLISSAVFICVLAVACVADAKRRMR